MLQYTTDFFSQLFTEDQNVDPSEILGLFQPVVTQNMNDELMKEFSDREIGDALFQIGPLKAPGPDGFPARFFQLNWGTLKSDVINAVRQFFNTGSMPPGANDTIIVLIPKSNDAKELKDFRPISLFNVVYKIVVKCIVNRMRPLLNVLISDVQSAFIPGRLITDNALVAFECFHAIQRGKGQAKDFCAYKLDLSKAYDRVDWKYHKGVLLSMGFSPIWVHRVMECVTSVWYSVKLNGDISNHFFPTRGLRQGDPLSPYLFLCVAEGLTKILNRVVFLEELKDLQICRMAPGVSHLLFGDDSLVFFKADSQQALVIKRALQTFEKASGQKLSSEKCFILFCNQCPIEAQVEIKNTLGIQKSTFEDKYLGFPTPEGGMKRDKFQPINEKLSKRLGGWNENHMAMGSKEILIKSVVQALPTFLMSIFILPVGFHEDYMKTIRNFWWGKDLEHRKVHWTAWDNLTLPKMQGGMGFRDTHLFNQALLARQAWRILVNPNTMCARVLKARYFPVGNFMDTVFSGDASPTWRGIEHGLQLLKKGAIWRIGDGTVVDYKRHCWLPRRSPSKISETIIHTRQRKVKDLFVQGTREWNVDKIRELFHTHDADDILKLKVLQHGTDISAWHFENSGIFSVKSAYKLAFDISKNAQENSGCSATGDDRRSIWKLLWKCKVPNRIRIFAWRCAKDNLPTKINKWRRTLEFDRVCSICGSNEESSHHAAVMCTKAFALRNKMREVWDLQVKNVSDLLVLIGSSFC